MDERKELVLYRNDLTYEGKIMWDNNEDVFYFHISKTLEPYRNAPIVLLEKKDGTFQVLKNVYSIKEAEEKLIKKGYIKLKFD